MHYRLGNDQPLTATQDLTLDSMAVGAAGVFS